MNDSATISEGNSIFAHRGKLLIALALVLGALSYFGFIAFKGATVYYMTVGEFTQGGYTGDQAVVRVSGKLVPSSYHRDEDTGLASFSITDGNAKLPAAYKGAVPDLFFNEHSELILEGSYNSQQVFEIRTIIVKCPSKYVATQKANASS